jgi:uncharacterized protein YegP (UPF0339 family)
MATATKRVRAARPVARVPDGVSASESLEFVVNRDNGGDYYWEIVGVSGESLAQSGSFASHGDAKRGARCVYDGAGSARFELDGAEEHQLVAV